MHGFVRALAVGLFAIFALGCGSSVQVIEPPTPGLKASSIRIIEDEHPAQIPMQDKIAFSRHLNEQLYRGEECRNGDELTLKYQIIRYNPGNRFLRYMLGFGAGAGKMVVSTTYLNQRGDSVGRIETEGWIAMGVFGGNFDIARRKAAGRIAEFTADTYGCK